MHKHQINLPKVTLSAIAFPALFLLLPLSGYSQLMFPGDTNNDGTANHFDLLPIGVAYGMEGPERFGASLVWTPQENTPWATTLPLSGIDLGFVDADGNGIIDSLDIDAIPLNYDSLQNVSIPPPMPWVLPDTFPVVEVPYLQLTFQENTVLEGDTAILFIDYVYPASMPPTASALAMAFTISFDGTLTDDSQTFFEPTPTATDLMHVAAATAFAEGWRSPGEGLVEIATSGRGTPALSMSRPIGKLGIIIEDMILQGQDFDTLEVDIPQRLLINLGEQVIDLGVQKDSLIIAKTVRTTSLTPAPKIQIFPNPVKEQLFIQLNREAEFAWRISNLSGKTFKQGKDMSRSATLSTSDLPSGFYFLEIVGEGWREVEKVFVCE
ncbi:MAG: T9SS type A sorting domain-containing protein [Bacteroidetes bacterium]|nr:T9SS type A sorting domain-containing protein [Bacteroidota bacterium]